MPFILLSNLSFDSIAASLVVTLALSYDWSWSLTDCIGSAFNIKGAMQCPNCRKIEKGQWLFATSSHSVTEISFEDWPHTEDLYDLGYSEMVNLCFGLF